MNLEMVDLSFKHYIYYLGKQGKVVSVLGADNLLNLLQGSLPSGTFFI